METVLKYESSSVLDGVRWLKMAYEAATGRKPGFLVIGPEKSLRMTHELREQGALIHDVLGWVYGLRVVLVQSDTFEVGE